MALWNGNPVAINCVLNYPSGSVKNAVRGSRLVVLPDYQGLGIGCKLSDYVASLYKHYGYRYYTKTIHPASGNYREKSPNWKGTSKNRKFRSDMRDRAYRYGNMKPLKRASFCHEYIGDPDNGEGLKLLDRIIDKLKKENST